MKPPRNKEAIYCGITAFSAVAAAIVFYMLIHKWETVGGAISLLFKSLRPITCGLIFAYILNPLMRTIENRLAKPLFEKLSKKNSSRLASFSRALSIFLAWTITIAALYILARLVIPELYANIESLAVSLPGYADYLIDMLGKLLEKNPEIQNFLTESAKSAAADTGVLADRLKGLIPNIGTLITAVSSGITGIVGMLLNILIGIIVSVYVLKDKEKLAAQCKRFLYSVLSVKNANGVIDTVRLANGKFGNYITGKIFDSAAVAVLCLAALTVFRIPYAALVSIVLGAANIIPFFGPFIGAVPSVVLILLADPLKCVTFVIIIFAVQQFDGNILEPKILSSSTGISSFWVMFSILAGGGLFGFWGIVCGVPVFAVIYALISRLCRSSLKRRGLDYSTEEFKKIDRLNDKTGQPVYFENGS